MFFQPTPSDLISTSIVLPLSSMMLSVGRCIDGVETSLFESRRCDLRDTATGRTAGACFSVVSCFSSHHVPVCDSAEMFRPGSSG